MDEGDDADEYEFIASGDPCGSCQAMEGTYPFRPGRPHPSCRCEIKKKKVGWHCRGYSVSTIRNYPGVAVYTVDIEVNCCCGSENDLTGSIEVEVPGNELLSESAAAHETIQEAFTELESECNDCLVA